LVVDVTKKTATHHLLNLCTVENNDGFLLLLFPPATGITLPHPYTIDFLDLNSGGIFRGKMGVNSNHKKRSRTPNKKKTEITPE
jgi:hypothetical protein